MTNIDNPISRLYNELLDNPPHDHVCILSDYSDDDIREVRDQLISVSPDEWDRNVIKLITSLLGE